MIKPVLAPADNQVYEQLLVDLPQALLIEAEAGLDSARLVDTVIATEPTTRFDVVALPNKTGVSAEQIRELLGSLRTFADRRRAVVIPNAENLSHIVQNILLKSLEEPNSGNHFILITTNGANLLSTVRSRCRIVTLHRTATRQDETLLKSCQLDAATRRQIAFLASGRPALIRQLIDQPATLEQYQRIARDAKTIMSGWGTYNALVTLGSYAKDRTSARQLISIIIDMIHFQARNGTMYSSELIDRLSEAETALDTNGNPRIALLSLAV